MSINCNQPVTCPEYQLCQKCGFTQEAIDQRVMQMGLDIHDKHRIKLLSVEVFQSQSHTIIDNFYDFLMRQPDMKKFITNAKQLKRLKTTQAEYLSRFGANFNTSEYFEYRLRIGIAHARIQLPLHLYLAAYAQIQTLIQQAVLNSSLCENSELIADCYSSIAKIIMLDSSLALDSYIYSTMHYLSDSVEELEHQKDSLTNQLMHDSLTGVLSRAYILDVIHKQLGKLQRDSSFIFNLALLDIDHFKNINDQYGHPAGDQVLQQFCKTVQSAIRQQDYFGRYGGEEFLLLMNDTDPHNALILVERIRLLIEKQKFDINGEIIRFTISLGFSQVRQDDDVDGLIERVDAALYRAKEAGRNKTVKG